MKNLYKACVAEVKKEKEIKAIKESLEEEEEKSNHSTVFFYDLFNLLKSIFTMFNRILDM
jgi:hypothetical protein